MKPEQARQLHRTALVIAGLLVLFVAALAAAIVFSTVLGRRKPAQCASPEALCKPVRPLYRHFAGD